MTSPGTDDDIIFHEAYPTPHEEQLVDEQLPHPDAPAADLVVVSPDGPDDLDTNPKADIRRAKSWLSQDGHSGFVLPMTRVSKLLPHALHLYS